MFRILVSKSLKTVLKFVCAVGVCVWGGGGEGEGHCWPDIGGLKTTFSL